jgi:signal transduction histidine kinase
MLQTQESAARRFSHELHDELGQSLAAVKANLTAASAASQDWQNRKADCIQLVDQSIANVRELSQLLHPVILDDFGLSAGLRWLGERFTERTGIRVQYTSNLEAARLVDETETHLFRIAQEALTNIARHSGATHVSIILEVDGAELELTIEDNGRGIRKAEPESTGQPSLGMTGMRARAREIGGDLRVEAALKDGTGVRVRVRAPMVLAWQSQSTLTQPGQEI